MSKQPEYTNKTPCMQLIIDDNYDEYITLPLDKHIVRADISVACAYGRTNFLKYIASNGYNIYGHRGSSINCSLQYHHSETSIWIIDNGIMNLHNPCLRCVHSNLMEDAAGYGDLEVVKYLYNHEHKETCLDNHEIGFIFTLYSAARSGRHEIIRWLIENHYKPIKEHVKTNILKLAKNVLPDNYRHIEEYIRSIM